MSVWLVAFVLFGAFLHAAWNATIKAGENKLFNTILVTTGSGLIAVLLLPLVPAPSAASWPYILASVLLQIVYYGLLAAAYHAGDMSQAYPLMRGTAPFLVALASGAVVGEAIPPMRWLGVVLIVGGVLGLAFGQRSVALTAPGRFSTRQLALLNACFIASYTIVDGLGVRLSGAPVAYTLWIFLLTALALFAWAMLRHARAFYAYSKGKWLLGLAGGGGSVASYGIALWAMTLAPVATVAALREMSILFGAIISAWVLREKMSGWRWASIVLAASGAMVIRTS
ncbi:MAG: EamA family transporter [Burkholderiales bacterium]|nr:EamA family transporter [Burkholderiales bacterium]